MKTKILLLAIAALSWVGCEDYLDKSPENLNLTDQDIYIHYRNFRSSLDRTYVLSMDHFLAAENGSRFAFGDEGIGTAKGTAQLDINNGGYTTTRTNIELGWYTDQDANSFELRYIPLFIYTTRNLRTVNLCIERIGELRDATPQQRDELLGQAYFMRAWNYFEIIRRWGGMFLFDKVFTPESDMDLPRLTYQKSTDWLVGDLDKAYELLPSRWDAANKGRATKAAALSLKSMALLYAASPTMCPQLNYQYDVEGCKKAADAAVTAINHITSTGCNRLMPGETIEEYSKIFYNKDILASDEAIWYQLKNYAASPKGSGLRPPAEWNASFIVNSRNAANVHCVAPTVNMVNQFEMGNGYLLSDPESGYNEQDPHINREKRFYYNILFNGVPYGTDGGVPQPFEFWSYDKMSATYKSADMMAQLSTTYNPRNPYLIRKWWPETANKWQNDYTYYMPSIYIRVAQLYLDFAEAANEAYGPTGAVPGTGLTALKAINLLRERVGTMPVLAKYYASKELFRDYIRKERTVELCYENHRWYDIRRWHIAKEVLKEPLITAYITREADGSFSYAYEKEALYQRTFDDKHYWYPIPITQMQMLNQVEQNPGWPRQ